METTLLIIRIVCSIGSLICSVYVVFQLNKINKHLEFQEVEAKIQIEEATYNIKSPRARDKNGTILTIGNTVLYRNKKYKIVTGVFPYTMYHSYLCMINLSTVPSEELLKIK